MKNPVAMRPSDDCHTNPPQADVSRYPRVIKLKLSARIIRKFVVIAGDRVLERILLPIVQNIMIK